ncbi:hypothetical protein AaE_013494 [Aphanomyces astaci]|uniref:DNA polymerase delta subunit 3 n=1 Tax=Aphanomyces astaci TaxID=112090 RepID=A0A6A4ZB47_APHAT|nr:hypothetical protein AaE_013494 [Aphanomyces astaci]
MAAALVEYIHEALDRNEAPHLVRICRSTGCSLQEGQDAMAQILTQEKDVQSVHVVVSTVINPETNTIAGKTISLVRGGDPDDETDLYAVYRSTESSSGRVDDALKNIMWFPRLDEGLGGTIASDIACDAASCGARNLVLKAAESASVFSNFKSTGTTKSTPLTRPSSSSASSKAPPKKQSTPFFGGAAAKAEPVTKARPPPPKSKSIVVDDSDEDSDDDETPRFVKKASHHKRLRVCDDSDDDDEAEFMPTSKPVQEVPPPVSPPTDSKPVTTSPETVSHLAPPAPIQSSQPNEVANKDKPIHHPPPQKRQKAVSTTRINEQGYMVTETTYEDVEDDDDLPPPPPQAKPSSGKLPAPPPKKNRVVKASGSAKQSNLMDFFGKK